MPINPLAAAKELAARSDWKLSNLELQKILFLSQMFYMGHNDGLPLIEGAFEAWDYGPVHPLVYHRLKVFGREPVRNVFRSVDEIKDHEKAEFLAGAYDSMKDFPPSRLVAITHMADGAWDNNYVPGRRGIVIPNEDIMNEYKLRATRVDRAD